MRPGDLPEFREQQLGRFADYGERIAVAEQKAEAGYIVAGPGWSDAALSLRGLRDIVCGPAWTESHWRNGDLFFVTDEMSRVATGAADTMPGFVLHPDDLPSPSGVLLFDLGRIALAAQGRPDLDAFDLVAVWGPDHSGARGDLLLTLLTRNPRKPEETMRLYSTSLRWGDDPLDNVTEAERTWARIVRCTWLLMQQRVAAIDVARPDRASSRRIARRGGRLDPVRVIRLRTQGGEREPGESDRVYSHRWVVRGHWRKQWYATQGRHVPIWISPFIKGPDDAPLLGGEKVYAWTR